MSTDQLSPLRPLFIGLGVVVALTLAVTIYCGAYTQRFANFRDIDASREKLKDIPMEIGNWVVKNEIILEADSVRDMQIENGYIARQYENKETREQVNFVMMLGPTGRVVVHTPEICFGGRNYQQEPKESFSLPGTIPDDEKSGEEKFWNVRFVNRATQGERTSFHYAVSSGDYWTAVENPRYEFRRFLYVYKIQVQAIVSRGGTDPAKDFLTDTLPTIRQYMSPCR